MNNGQDSSGSRRVIKCYNCGTAGHCANQCGRFEGREPMLKGHIYDFTGERNPDQYTKTTDKIIDHVGRTHTKYTAEFTRAIRDLHLEDPLAPADPESTQDVCAMFVWKLDLEEHRSKVLAYSNFRVGLYNLIFGQCTYALQYNLESHPNFQEAYLDGIALLKIIKLILYSFEQA